MKQLNSLEAKNKDFHQFIIKEKNMFLIYT